MELRESLKEFFANLNELQGGTIGLEDPAKLQTIKDAVNNLSKSFAKEKSSGKTDEQLELEAMHIGSDIYSMLRTGQ